jgi:hypothetical protein
LPRVALLSLVNGYGSNATAAYGAVNQVVAYVQFPAISIAITASILGAQAIGAGRTDKLGAITRTGLQMNLALTGLLVLLGYLFSRHLMGFFITSEPVIELSQTLLHIMLWSSVDLRHGQGVVSGVMRASGTVLGAHGYFDFLHCIDRSSRGLVHEPPHRHQRHLGGLPGDFMCDAGPADRVLPAGMEEAGDPEVDLMPGLALAARLCHLHGLAGRGLPGQQPYAKGKGAQAGARPGKP